MTLERSIAWTFFVGVGFALFTNSASAQPEIKPVKDASAVNAVTNYRDIGRGGIPATELKNAREQFAKFAKYFADVVKYPPVYKNPQEFKIETPANQTLTIDGPNGILQEISRFMIEPFPGNAKATPDQAAYITEFGAAFDAALKTLIESDPEPIVRVNAARVLAHVCRGGSPAHYATLTTLLSNANVRTEVKYYLFQAAANLLAAYNVTDLTTRAHSGDPKQVAGLVIALQDCITKPDMIFAGLPKNDIKAATPDQLAVIAFVRRQAVHALAQVRFVSIPGLDGKTVNLHPAYTLVRIALADPAIVPAAGPAEAAEAAIGICNMAPVKGYNADVAAEAVTSALVTFARPRAANAFDKSLPWRTYSLRIAEALRGWRPLFDPNYSLATPAKFDASSVPALIEDMYKEVVPKVLAPMDKVDGSGKPDVGAKVDIEGLLKRLATLKENPKRNTTLFAGKPETTIEFAIPKK
jgi:hypothetical protein